MPAGKKTRQGCARCKEKRVKCDESKPSCQRCVRSKQACPGYVRPLRWSSKHELLELATRSSANKTSLTISPPRTTQAKRGEFSSATAHDQTTPASLDTACSVAGSLNQSSTLDDCDLFPDGLIAPELWSGDVAQENLFQFDLQDEQYDALYDFDGVTHLPSLPESIDAVSLSDHVQNRQVLHSSNLNSDLIGNSRVQPPPTICQGRNLIYPVLVRSEDTLVKYYFKEVATIYSCYDGDMNPFRSTIASLWTSSALIAKTLQSMAAACLTPEYPNLAIEGSRLRDEVSADLQNNLGTSESVDVALLVTIMLGQTAGWHDPKDLGITWYHSAKDLFSRLRSESNEARGNVLGTDISFFNVAIEYWEMLFAFVSGKQSKPLPALHLTQRHQMSSLVEPHPWALVVPGLLQVIREVGELVWENRTTSRLRKFWLSSDLTRFHEAISHSRILEKQLLEYHLPLESEILDPLDKFTPVAHMLTICQAYIHVALIQIYRVFPDVLSARIESQKMTDTLTHCDSHNGLRLDATSEVDRDVWLRNFASDALNLIKSIPLESRTRTIQPFLLIALSGEIGPICPIRNNLPDHLALSAVENRRFIRGRLETFRLLLPPKPAQCRLDLVLEIWKKLDNGGEDVYWLDIVIDKGWHYLFG